MSLYKKIQTVHQQPKPQPQPQPQEQVRCRSPKSPQLYNYATDGTITRDGKTTVYVQVVFMKLGEIDTIKETFSADVFIQARWREPRLDGSETASKKNAGRIDWADYWNPKLYVDNCVGEPKETIGRTVVYDVNTWEAFIVERRRLKGTFLENLELFHFPFDTQDLTVTVMSERLEDEVQLLDDHKQPSTINVESFVDEQEWRLYQEVETFNGVVNKFYEGDATEMCAHPSFSCRTHASRRPGFYITNIFVVMCYISSLVFTTYSVRCLQPEHRVELTFILLLTTVTFKFTVNASLPRISYLTTLDVYIMMSMTVLVLVCIWHAIVPQIAADWGLPLAHITDMIVLVILGLVFVAIHVLFVLWIRKRALRRKRYYEQREHDHLSGLKSEQSRCHSNADVLQVQDIRRASKFARQPSPLVYHF